MAIYAAREMGLLLRRKSHKHKSVILCLIIILNKNGTTNYSNFSILLYTGGKIQGSREEQFQS